MFTKHCAFDIVCSPKSFYGFGLLPSLCLANVGTCLVTFHSKSRAPCCIILILKRGALLNGLPGDVFDVLGASDFLSKS